MKRRLRQLAAFSLLGVTAWMSYDNVFSDDGPIRALAEQAACAKRPCNEQHGFTREERMPWGQGFDIAWRDATFHVSCHRAFYVAGERGCQID